MLARVYEAAWLADNSVAKEAREMVGMPGPVVLWSAKKTWSV